MNKANKTTKHENCNSWLIEMQHTCFVNKKRSLTQKRFHTKNKVFCIAHYYRCTQMSVGFCLDFTLKFDIYIFFSNVNIFLFILCIRCMHVVVCFCLYAVDIFEVRCYSNRLDFADSWTIRWNWFFFLSLSIFPPSQKKRLLSNISCKAVFFSFFDSKLLSIEPSSNNANDNGLEDKKP